MSPSIVDLMILVLVLLAILSAVVGGVTGAQCVIEDGAPVGALS